MTTDMEVKSCYFVTLYKIAQKFFLSLVPGIGKRRMERDQNFEDDNC